MKYCYLMIASIILETGCGKDETQVADDSIATNMCNALYVNTASGEKCKPEPTTITKTDVNGELVNCDAAGCCQEPPGNKGQASKKAAGQTQSGSCTSTGKGKDSHGKGQNCSPPTTSTGPAGNDQGQDQQANPNCIP